MSEMKLDEAIAGIGDLVRWATENKVAFFDSQCDHLEPNWSDQWCTIKEALAPKKCKEECDHFWDCDCWLDMNRLCVREVTGDYYEHTSKGAA